MSRSERVPHTLYVVAVSARAYRVVHENHLPAGYEDMRPRQVERECEEWCTWLPASQLDVPGPDVGPGDVVEFGVAAWLADKEGWE